MIRIGHFNYIFLCFLLKAGTIYKAIKTISSPILVGSIFSLVSITFYKTSILSVTYSKVNKNMGLENQLANKDVLEDVLKDLVKDLIYKNIKKLWD